MSQWTHVAGLIRIDSVGATVITSGVIDKDHHIAEVVRTALGHTWKYDDSEEEADACSVPTGTEGSLQYVVQRNEGEEDSHGLSWGFVAIYGDLRNYESVEGIAEWFKGALEKLRKPAAEITVEAMNPFDKAMHLLGTFMIRDAVLSIDVEGRPRTILSWNDQQQAMTQLLVD